ncbi:MAG: family 20 glycosylhydrolase [Candidatus Cryptobacteroides sp.]
MRRVILLSLLLLAGIQSNAAEQADAQPNGMVDAQLKGKASDIIPAPGRVVVKDGFCKLDGGTKIKVIQDKGIRPEGYLMKITPKGISIRCADGAGEFYARQTLRQMSLDGRLEEVECCEIEDSPRFPYRGLHFDVSRHFRSVDFLKKQIDAMTYFKLNKMHLHLTDAAGWRVKIDSYPRLTSYGAWRPQALWKEWWKPENRKYADEGTPGAYGGYYTREDIREIVEYAAQRHIDVIPEIEMPGHSEEALAAYPELACGGVPRGGEFCIGREETFKFLEAVLDEVIGMFPYEYVHIGGDEAARSRWQECPDCRRRMEEEGLKDVAELQSYLIRRIEAHLNSKGRKIIGWDEILEGGVTPGATVMSWRGTKGGIEALKNGNDVIMCPGNFCYFDHAQDAPFREPESIGGYLPLETVYGYDPAEGIVEEGAASDGSGLLQGLQGNLWTEYVADDSHAEYMYWPRAIAIAETAWSLPGRKDYPDFRERTLKALALLEDKGYTVFDLADEYGQRKAVGTGLIHKGIGAKVTYAKRYHSYYPADGDGALTDGKAGGWANNDGRWQGFISDVDVTIDLGQATDIHYVGATFMQIKGPEIFLPERAEVYLSSDGIDFTPAGTSFNELPADTDAQLFRDFNIICDTTARYIRYVARRNRSVGGWLFVDEIVIN